MSATVTATMNAKRVERWVDRGFLTSSMVARFCGVASRTASGWIDNGKLKGYRIPARVNRPPGVGDRRVKPLDLLEFMRKHGMPIPEELRAAELTPLYMTFGVENIFVKFTPEDFSNSIAMAVRIGELGLDRIKSVVLGCIEGVTVTRLLRDAIYARNPHCSVYILQDETWLNNLSDWTTNTTYYPVHEKDKMICDIIETWERS